jgi:hypothetical protein
MKLLPVLGNLFRKTVAFKALHFSGLTGRRLSRNLTIILLLLLLTAFLPLFAQPTVEWNKTIGGSASDDLKFVQQTSDGGYILGGSSGSPSSGDKTEGVRKAFYTRMPELDYWVVKLDAAGNKQWDKTIGGAEYDELTSLEQTSDGGYILGGFSFSGADGDKTEPFRSECCYSTRFPDYWVVKLDSTGNKQWDKTIGGAFYDALYALHQTRDGGYVLGGISGSHIGDDKTEANKGDYDYWVVKLDGGGNKQWDKTYGGTGYDALRALQQTSDGGFILGGNSSSGIGGDKTELRRGPCEYYPNTCTQDYWVVKLDGAGNKQWDKTYGGSDQDSLTELRQTSDGGYILGGSSESDISGDKTEASRISGDYWVVRLDAAGNKQWDKTIGGGRYDELTSLEQTMDGGYILGGGSPSTIRGDKTQ